MIAGEVWHDPSQRFSGIRKTLKAYYPEPVRLRRPPRALVRLLFGDGGIRVKGASFFRGNDYYSNITFTRAIRLGVQDWLFC